MIKNYPLLFTLFFLQPVIMQSGIGLPQNFDGVLGDKNPWNNAESIKNGDWSITIPEEFNNLSDLAKIWEQKRICYSKPPEYKREKQELNNITSEIKRLNFGILNQENNVAIYNKQIDCDNYSLKNEKNEEEIKKINKSKIQALFDLAKTQTTIVSAKEELKQLNNNKIDLEKIINSKTVRLKLQTENLAKNDDVIINSIPSNIDDFSKDSNEVKSLVYIQALMATYLNKEKKDFTNNFSRYQIYIAALGNFFNWYIAENGTYNELFENFTNKLVGHNDEYKDSFINLIKNALSFYKDYALARLANEASFAEEQICKLLAPFKNYKEFKDIYEQNFKAIKDENKDGKQGPKNGEGEKGNIDHDKSKNTPWGKYLGIGILLVGFGFALYNYKKILEYFPAKRTQ